jgi:hypothetical protein
MSDHRCITEGCGKPASHECHWHDDGEGRAGFMCLECTNDAYEAARQEGTEFRARSLHGEKPKVVIVQGVVSGPGVVGVEID